VVLFFSALMSCEKSKLYLIDPANIDYLFFIIKNNLIKMTNVCEKTFLVASLLFVTTVFVSGTDLYPDQDKKHSTATTPLSPKQYNEYMMQREAIPKLIDKVLQRDDKNDLKVGEHQSFEDEISQFKKERQRLTKEAAKVSRCCCCTIQ
jgi:hypothetical protein